MYNSNAVTNSPGIYQIVNKITQKRYVGYATNLRTRWNGHLYDLTKNKHPNNYFQKAWNKYGESNFSFEILQECSKESLCLHEDYWARILKVNDPEFGYNLKETDPDGKAGHSLETIEKIKQAKRLNPQKVRDMRGDKNPMYGKTRSEETRRKAGINITKNRKHWKRWKRVLNWENGVIYCSLTEAALSLKMPKWKLSKYLLGTRTNNTNLIYI